MDISDSCIPCPIKTFTNLRIPQYRFKDPNSALQYASNLVERDIVPIVWDPNSIAIMHWEKVFPKYFVAQNVEALNNYCSNVHDGVIAKNICYSRNKYTDMFHNAEMVFQNKYHLVSVPQNSSTRSASWGLEDIKSIIRANYYRRPVLRRIDRNMVVGHYWKVWRMCGIKNSKYRNPSFSTHKTFQTGRFVFRLSEHPSQFFEAMPSVFQNYIITRAQLLVLEV